VLGLLLACGPAFAQAPPAPGTAYYTSSGVRYAGTAHADEAVPLVGVALQQRAPEPGGPAGPGGPGPAPGPFCSPE
jgi:hypothetical protein